MAIAYTTFFSHQQQEKSKTLDYISYHIYIYNYYLLFCDEDKRLTSTKLLYNGIHGGVASTACC